MKIAIIGSRGIPAKYGGFETFAEKLSSNLVQRGHKVRVYCSAGSASNRSKFYEGTERVFIPSIPIKSLEKFTMSVLSIIHSLFRKDDIILLLGVSPALISWLPRLFSKKLVINIDGLEWKRAKWNRIISFHLKMSEKLAGKFCNVVVTDSEVIQKYYFEKYKTRAVYIPYGADEIEDSNEDVLEKYGLKKSHYILQVCRLEPENNVHLTVTEFLQVKTNLVLAILGDNPFNTKYIQILKDYRSPKIKFLGSIYGDDYKTILKNAYCYIHGHEVGGTNPALLEAMSAGKCVVVLNVPFNLEVINDAGISFRKEKGDLANKLKYLIENHPKVKEYEKKALERVREKYTWEKVINEYESLFLNVLDNKS